jgi:hypothetical protein
MAGRVAVDVPASVTDIDVSGRGQTVMAAYDYGHGAVRCLTCVFATVMRMG